MTSRMKTVLQDAEVLDELRAGALLDPDGGAESLAPMASLGDMGGQRGMDDAINRLLGDAVDPFDMSTTEAIVMRHGYPSLLVRNGTFEKPKLKVWDKRLTPYRDRIDTAIASVGRVELVGHPDFLWCGTGWLIDEGVIITNRHVAAQFVRRAGRGFAIRESIQVSMDFKEEHEVRAELVAGVEEIIHIDLERRVDLALMRLNKSAAANLKMTPIPVADRLEDVEFLGVIGYPAKDPRNDMLDQSRIFDDIYNVKRLAPGKVIGQDDIHTFNHNATTLGGNSGSAVIDVSTGAAVGLHFSGKEGEANTAVRPAAILDRCRRFGVQVTALPGADGGGGGGGDAGAEGVFGGDLSDREGYDPGFLGGGSMSVPLPRLNELQMRQAAKLPDGSTELKYTHFSLAMSAARRLAYFTAVNIDGTSLWHNPRGRDKWFTDPRIPEDAQVDNALYTHNDFDRGHLVRRLDPVWGPKGEAEQAERDTFFYTNAAPQHKDLNRKIWLGLENHVLTQSDDRDAKISVFAGPVFGDSDPRSKRTGLEEVGVPLGFWKIIASIGRTSGRRRKVLQAQGFVLWQWDMFGDRDLELIFGAGFETQQRSIADLERLTGLDFGSLKAADTFEEPAEDDSESLAALTVAHLIARRRQVIRTLDDIL